MEITFMSKFTLTLGPCGRIGRRARPRTRRTPLSTYTQRGRGSSPRRMSADGSSLRWQHRSGQHHPRQPGGSPQSPDGCSAPALARRNPTGNSRALDEERWLQDHTQPGGRLLRGCLGRTSRQAEPLSSEGQISEILIDSWEYLVINVISSPLRLALLCVYSSFPAALRRPLVSSLPNHHFRPIGGGENLDSHYSGNELQTPRTTPTSCSTGRTCRCARWPRGRTWPGR